MIMKNLKKFLFLYLVLFLLQCLPNERRTAVIDEFFTALSTYDQKMMDEILLKSAGPFHFGNALHKYKWKIIYEENIPKSEEHGGEMMIVVESQTDDSKKTRTVFYLARQNNRWKITGYYALFQGEDPESDFSYIYFDGTESNGCSISDLKSIYSQFSELIHDHDMVQLKRFLPKILHSTISYKIATTNENLSPEKFMDVLFQEHSLLNDFIYDTSAYRKRFKNSPYERFYDESKNKFVKVDLTRILKSVKEFMPVLKKSTIKVKTIESEMQENGTLQSDIQFSKESNIPIEVLVNPKFICTRNGWKMTHFYSKW